MKRIIRLTESDLSRIVKRVVNESFGSVNSVIDKLDSISPDTSWEVKRRVGRLLHDKITNRDDMDLIYRYMLDLKRKTSEKSKGDEKSKESDSEKNDVNEWHKKSFYRK